MSGDTPLSLYQLVNTLWCNGIVHSKLIQLHKFGIRYHLFPNTLKNAFIWRFLAIEGVQAHLYCPYKPFVATLQTTCSATAYRKVQNGSYFSALPRLTLYSEEAFFALCERGNISSPTHMFGTTNFTKHPRQTDIKGVLFFS